MPTTISPLSQVHPSAEIGRDVTIGPFCLIGPHVKLGDHCVLESHVSLIGHCRIGKRNRFLQNVVIGGEPQDKSYDEDAPTGVSIGNDNMFREGVTVNRGAEKEDHWTHLGSRNLLMSNDLGSFFSWRFVTRRVSVDSVHPLVHRQTLSLWPNMVASASWTGSHLAFRPSVSSSP